MLAVREPVSDRIVVEFVGFQGGDLFPIAAAGTWNGSAQNDIVAHNGLLEERQVEIGPELIRRHVELMGTLDLKSPRLRTRK